MAIVFSVAQIHSKHSENTENTAVLYIPPDLGDFRNDAKYSHHTSRAPGHQTVHMSFRILCAFFLALLVSSSATKCYTADGYAVEDDKYMPCIGIDKVESMCCRLNDTSPDTCLSNGLCFANSSFANGYWMDFCTDQKWESPNCLAKSICSTAVRYCC